jgi:hypothetical protein
VGVFLKFTGPFRDPFLWNFLFIWVVRVGGRPGTVTVLNWGRKKIRCCFRGCTKRGDVREMGMQIFRGRLSSLSRGENVCTNVRAGLEGISLDK